MKKHDATKIPTIANIASKPGVPFVGVTVTVGLGLGVGDGVGVESGSVMDTIEEG